MRYPNHLLKLIEVLKKLPGVGNKSAERFAFHLLDWSPSQLSEAADVFKTIPEKLRQCGECGCLIGLDPCIFCSNDNRDQKIVCLIASPKDVFAIENTKEYSGLYHVIGGLLSPLDGRGPETLSLAKLKKRIEALQIQEVVIALDSTLEGDATSLFLKQDLASFNLSISRLAFGLPMGSSLDYVDGGTLARAFSGRRKF